MDWISYMWLPHMEFEFPLWNPHCAMKFWACNPRVDSTSASGIDAENNICTYANLRVEKIFPTKNQTPKSYDTVLLIFILWAEKLALITFFKDVVYKCISQRPLE